MNRTIRPNTRRVLRPVEAFEMDMVEDVVERDWTPLLGAVVATVFVVGCWVVAVWVFA